MQTRRGFGDGAPDMCAARGRPAEGSGDQRRQDDRGRFGDGKMSKRQGGSPGSKSLPGIRCAGGSWAEHRSETEEHGVAAWESEREQGRVDEGEGESGGAAGGSQKG
jgi:hypothetical protein